MYILKTYETVIFVTHNLLIVSYRFLTETKWPLISSYAARVAS